jgi:hypothetical protein
MTYVFAFPKSFDNTFSLFSKNNEPIKSGYLNGLLVLSGSALFIGGLGLLYMYSKIIYPNLVQSFGGGKSEKIIYYTDNGTVAGMKIYETDKYVFLSDSDSTIIKLDWNEINKIVNPRK